MEEAEMTTAQKVMALVREKGTVMERDVITSLGLKNSHASVVLLRLLRAGRVKREGTPRKYVYSVA